ncbi:MAG TPA: hypothetical protein ENJ80_12955 [Gammaproteobacteria bacterium]|nr:hypothetical protein [Gammaproteobacteria bacterium]
MHPHDCPGWDYEHHPRHDSILPSLCEALLLSLKNGHVEHLSACSDTRFSHGCLFGRLTPDNYPYFAGHYRGEDFRCLKYYDVRVGMDPRVGVYAAGVIRAANFLSEALETGFKVLEEAWAKPDTHLPRHQKIFYTVAFSTRILVEFLRIHPYANGNGHMGRFIIFMILAKFNLWPKKWPLDESPPYHQLISDYRDGKPDALEQFILRCLIGK